jgi:hypothetical protein
MSTSTSHEVLFEKALHGEPMTSRELRDFGAALVANPELAREYALLRRIVLDTAQLPRPALSPDFTDRVMDRVARLPQPAPRPFPVSLWGLAAASVLIVLTAAGIHLWESAPVVAEGEAVLWNGVAVAEGAGEQIWMHCYSLWSTGRILSSPYMLGCSLFVVSGMAFTLNAWLVRQTKGHPIRPTS